jgi:hypothetical protein
MGSVIEWLQLGMPACVTFGPVFLVMDGKSARWTRVLRYLGVAMVVCALGTMYLVTGWQKGRIGVLEARTAALEQRLEQRCR